MVVVVLVVVAVVLVVVVVGGAVVVGAREVEEWEAAGRLVPQPARRTIPTISRLIPTFGHLPTAFIIQPCSPPGNDKPPNANDGVVTARNCRIPGIHRAPETVPDEPNGPTDPCAAFGGSLAYDRRWDGPANRKCSWCVVM